MQEFWFFAIIFLNVDNSVNIKTRLFKLCVLILDIIMEGTVSQIFYFGPSSYFMLFRKLFLQNLKNILRFLSQKINQAINKKSEIRFPPNGVEE